MDNRSEPDVSVIVASIESSHTMAECIRSIRGAVGARQHELIVVDASRDGSADIAEGIVGAENVVRCRPGLLAPQLWAVGIARSRGRLVALTTGHFIVEPSWVSSLTCALGGRIAGTAGAMALADKTAVTDWAVFYLRYSEFLAAPNGVRDGVPGIPADNAAYDGTELRRFVTATSNGFWEVEFHQQLHAAGRSLALVAGALARYGRSFPFGTIARHRFSHGIHSGAWRAASGARSAPAIVLAAPLVPPLLAVRAWRRVRRLPEHRRRFLQCLPTFLALATMWALGEVVGATRGGPATPRPVVAPV